MINTNFNTFGPRKGETVTTTRPMTLRERKEAQKKAYSDYVACTINDLVEPELLKGRKFKDIVIKVGLEFDGLVDQYAYTIKFEYNDLEARYTITGAEVDGFDIFNKYTILVSGDVSSFQEALNDRFDLCQMARILKLVNKQIKDYRALQGNKPQPKKAKAVKTGRVKQNEEKVTKFSYLEKFEKDYKKLMAKYPDVRVYGNRDGDPMAYTTDPFNKNLTVSILL